MNDNSKSASTSISTTDSGSAEQQRDAIYRQVAWTTGPDGMVDMGKVWDGVLAGLEMMTPEERSPLLEKLNKRVAAGWGKENAAGMRTSTNDGRITNDAAIRANETARNYWAAHGVGAAPPLPWGMKA